MEYPHSDRFVKQFPFPLSGASIMQTNNYKMLDYRTEDFEFSVARLAFEFSFIVREWCNPEELAEIIRRNQTPAYRDFGCCASHDFYDTNEAMAEAFERVFGEAPPMVDDASESECERGGYLWNSAWDKAKANDFAL